MILWQRERNAECAARHCHRLAERGEINGGAAAGRDRGENRAAERRARQSNDQRERCAAESARGRVAQMNVSTLFCTVFFFSSSFFFLFLLLYARRMLRVSFRLFGLFQLGVFKRRFNLEVGVVHVSSHEITVDVEKLADRQLDRRKVALWPRHTELDLLTTGQHACAQANLAKALAAANEVAIVLPSVQDEIVQEVVAQQIANCANITVMLQRCDTPTVTTKERHKP